MRHSKNDLQQMPVRIVVALLALLLPSTGALGSGVLPLVPLGASQCDGFYRYNAKVVRVYDGDTIWADIDLGFYTWRMNEKLRLIGIDAPELKGRKFREVTAAEKKRAIISRDKLRGLIGGRDVVICTIKDKHGHDKQGKYGRYLARVFLGDLDVNNWMLTHGYAVPYGQRKAAGTRASEAVRSGTE